MITTLSPEASSAVITRRMMLAKSVMFPSRNDVAL
jgi:hypothetical protein